MTPALPPPMPMEPPALWWIDVLTLSPLMVAAVVALVLWRQARTSKGYVQRQFDYLDHQKGVSDRVLDQNKSFEEMIANQYAATNVRTDRALAQSEEAIRLHEAALKQLTAINETLLSLARTLEPDRPKPGA